MGLLHFGLILALFLAHDHVTLSQISFDLEAVLFVSVPRLASISWEYLHQVDWCSELY